MTEIWTVRNGKTAIKNARKARVHTLKANDTQIRLEHGHLQEGKDYFHAKVITPELEYHLQYLRSNSNRHAPSEFMGTVINKFEPKEPESRNLTASEAAEVTDVIAAIANHHSDSHPNPKKLRDLLKTAEIFAANATDYKRTPHKQELEEVRKITTRKDEREVNYEKWIEENQLDKPGIAKLIKLATGHNDSTYLRQLGILHELHLNGKDEEHTNRFKAENTRIRKYSIPLDYKRISIAGHLVGLFPRPPNVSELEIEEIREHLRENLTDSTTVKLPLLNTTNNATPESKLTKLYKLALIGDEIALAALHSMGTVEYPKLSDKEITRRFGVKADKLPLIVEAARHCAEIEPARNPYALLLAENFNEKLNAYIRSRPYNKKNKHS